MTEDLLVTRWQYQNLYANLPSAFIEIDLTTLEVVTNIMHADEMTDARKLFDEKISTWK